MSIKYSPNYCENCKRENSGIATGFQYFLCGILTAFGIIPGIIYYFIAKSSRSFICGLKKGHRKTETTKKDETAK